MTATPRQGGMCSRCGGEGWLSLDAHSGGTCGDCNGTGLVTAAPDRPDTAAEVERDDAVAALVAAAKAEIEQQCRDERDRLATILANTRPNDEGTEGEWANALYAAGVRAPKLLPFASGRRFVPSPLAARRPATEAEQAVERALDAVTQMDEHADTMDNTAESWRRLDNRSDWARCAAVADALREHADRIRAALDGAARDGSDG